MKIGYIRISTADQNTARQELLMEQLAFILSTLAMFCKTDILTIRTEYDIFARLEPLLRYYPQRDRGIITDRVCATILLRQKQL